MDVTEWSPFDNAPERISRVRANSAPDEFLKPGGYAARRCRFEPLPVVEHEAAKRRLAELRRLLQHCVEHRGEVTRRGIDDPQHLGGRGLLLQGLARLGQEPRILHRDHRLVSEGADQLDFFLGVSFDALARQTDDPDRLAVAQQWHAEHRVDASDPRIRLGFVERVGPGVEDMHGASIQGGTADQGAGARPDPHLALDLLVFGHQRGAGRPAILAADIPVQYRLVGAAQPDRGRDHGLQHRLEIERCAADDLQHVADRGLVFERLFEIPRARAQFAQQPRILDRDHRLRREILQ